MVLTRETREEIEKAVNSAVNDIFKDETFIKLIVNKVSIAVVKTMELKLAEMEGKISDLDLKLQKLEENHMNEIADMRNNILKIPDGMKKLQDKYDHLDQNSRRKNLRIFQLAEKQNENTREEVLKLINKNMGFSVKSEDIDICYRIGKKYKKDRGIYLRMKTYELRQRIFNAKKFLKGTGVVIREDLTQSRVALFNRTVEKAGLKQVWTNDGRIFALINDGVLVIKSEEQLIGLFEQN